MKMLLPMLVTSMLFGVLALGQGSAQSSKPLPADVNADSLMRLPPLQRAELDADGKKIFDSLSGPKAGENAPPLRGILGLGIYNPKLAEALHLLHDSVIRDGTLGNRVNELAILVATREEDMSMNEWYSHEAAALKVGVPQAAVDSVKFSKDAKGLDDRDALVIQFGRELFRAKHISPGTFSRAIAVFGQRGTVELIGVMADYSMVGLMLRAVDQQNPGREVLPALKAH
jgi:4-carboxymuconolactone decarboxylase